MKKTYKVKIVKNSRVGAYVYLKFEELAPFRCGSFRVDGQVFPLQYVFGSPNMMLWIKTPNDIVGTEAEYISIDDERTPCGKDL